eukprot:7273593-Lingulodinium_polyedra.AAC.1
MEAELGARKSARLHRAPWRYRGNAQRPSTPSRGGNPWGGRRPSIRDDEDQGGPRAVSRLLDGRAQGVEDRGQAGGRREALGERRATALSGQPERVPGAGPGGRA